MRRSKSANENTNHQAPSSREAPSTKLQSSRSRGLEFVIWSFSGAWCLELGASRAVNLHEYQAKQLLAQHGVAVPAGEVCETPESARKIAARLLSEGANLLAVKSQIH